MTLFRVPSLNSCNETFQEFRDRESYLFRRNHVPAFKLITFKESQASYLSLSLQDMARSSIIMAFPHSLIRLLWAPPLQSASEA